MNRRGFLKSIVGFAVASKFLPAQKPVPNWRTDARIVSSKPSEELAAIMDEESYFYRYVYRNTITGHSSDASPVSPPTHTFAMPEHDVMDVYRLQDSGSFEWVATL
jgi:hypothetical protein